MSTFYAVMIITVVAAVTFGIRALPFLLWGKGSGTPNYIRYFEWVLPPAVMGMLIVYSLRNTAFAVYPYGLPEGAAIAAVVLLHIWKKNSLLSILGGTALYMFLVQVVFV